MQNDVYARRSGASLVWRDRGAGAKASVVHDTCCSRLRRPRADSQPTTHLQLPWKRSGGARGSRVRPESRTLWL